MKHLVALIFVLVCALRQTSADLLIVPENEAVVAGVGTTVLLRCSSSISPPVARILWTEFATTPLGSVISDNRGLVPTHPNVARYAILGDPEDNEYFLQIINVVVGDGGVYLCQDVQGAPPGVFRGYAQLVVLETEPQCTDYSTGSGVVIDGLMYSAECEVRYRGNLVPNTEWFGPVGFFIRNGTTPPNSVWSWMAFTALREIDAQVFYHRTNFTTVVAEPGYATNIPTYEHSHFGAPLDVSWPPRSMQVTPIKPTYEVGDELICAADSKPPADYQWQNMRTLVFAPPGPSFIITADLQGFDQVMRCNAIVRIDGSVYQNDIFANVSVPTPTTTPVPTTPPPTTPAPADGPCSNLAGRWTATNPSATICMDIDAKGNVFTIIRNGTDMFFVVGQGKTVANDYKHLGFTAHWPQTGVGGFSGECHSCYGTELLLMSGLYRNKHSHDVCGESGGTHVTNLLVFVRSGPICVGMEVDEVRTRQPWIVEKMGIKAKKITTF